MTSYHTPPTQGRSSLTGRLGTDTRPGSGLSETLRVDTTSGPRPELELHVSEGLTDDERTRRLMPTIGNPADAMHAEAMSLLDGCPTACGDTALPHLAEHRSGDDWTCHYRCTCGETWQTGWKVG